MRLNGGEYFGTREPVVHLAGMTICRAEYRPRTRLPRHSHAQPYLCLVGAGQFEERARRRVERCRSGSVVWNPSGDEHEDRFGNAGARTWNLELTHVWEERIEQAATGWTAAHHLEARWLVTGILQELSRPDSASTLALEGMVCALLGEVSRDRTIHEQGRPRWLTSAEERLREDFRVPPSVDALARDAGVHRSHFARAFRRHFGCTIAEFVRRLRIEWAAEQLRSQHCSLSHLSLDAGFGDQAHFTRTFKRVTGVTPGEYRAARR